MWKTPNQLGKYFFLILIQTYRIILSPILPPACRYLPSCSEYAAEALHKHGAVKGILLIIKRLARCHPFGKSGYDPVPENYTIVHKCSKPPKHCC